jgi:Holliday junction resolvase RusA-like endonuclease
MIIFTVPGKPTGKGRPRFASRGKYVTTYTPEKTANYENWIKVCFMKDYPDFKPLEEPLRLTFIATFIKPKSNKMKFPTIKPDCDNLIKCMDALNGIAFLDDKQIVSVLAEKKWGNNECVEIRLEPMEYEF